MATINNINLSIKAGTSGSRKKVTVKYQLSFTTCEVLAGSVFNEKVTLRGDDPIWDDHLITIRNGCVKAEKQTIDRQWVRQVSKTTLDEDGDTVITLFGWEVLCDADRDEIYARVKLTPFSPSGSEGDSNMVYGQFGKCG